MPGPSFATVTLPSACVFTSASVPAGEWTTAFSTKFLIASAIASAFPFARKVLRLQPYRRRMRADRGRLLRHVTDRLEAAADGKNADRQCGQHEKRHRPNNVVDKFPQE